MKILNALKLDKYDDTVRYTQHDGFVYKDVTGGAAGRMLPSAGPVYCVTLRAELEADEDTQYPLEDILDKYLLNCTEVTEEKEEAGKRIFLFEMEGKNEEAVKTVADLVGKRVFNYEDGDCIKLGIE